MRLFLIRLLDCRLAKAFRAVALLSFAAAVLGVVIAAATPQDIQNNAVVIEHRFTALESDVKEIKDDIADVKHYGWAFMIGLVGLLGEAGIRNLKRFTGSEG